MYENYEIISFQSHLPESCTSYCIAHKSTIPDTSSIVCTAISAHRCFHDPSQCECDKKVPTFKKIITLPIRLAPIASILYEIFGLFQSVSKISVPGACYPRRLTFFLCGKMNTVFCMWHNSSAISTELETLTLGNVFLY